MNKKTFVVLALLSQSAWPQNTPLPLVTNATPLPLVTNGSASTDKSSSIHPLKRWAQTAAAADSISTHIAMSASEHLTEANSLVNTSPAGLLALFVVKLSLLEIVERHYPEQKPAVFRNASAVWGGVSASNLALAAGAAGPLALAVGLASGAYIYSKANETTKAHEATSTNSVE